MEKENRRGKDGIAFEGNNRSGKAMWICKKREFQEIVVDTTVQEKNIDVPTDSGLYYKALKRLVRLSKESGIKLRQTYRRKAKEKLVRRNRLSSRGKRKEGL